MAGSHPKKRKERERGAAEYVVASCSTNPRCSHAAAHQIRRRPRSSHAQPPATTTTTTTTTTKTVSLAIGASCVENAVSHELGSMLAGQLARAAAIFNIDEVVVLDDGPKHSDAQVSRAAALLAAILQYQETPQYLRKALIPMHEFYRYCGMLAPLDAPNHLRANEWFECREGVVVDHLEGSTTDGTILDIGLETRALVEGPRIPHNTRVTLDVGKERRSVRRNGEDFIHGTIGNPLTVRHRTGRYWGYVVRVARDIDELLNGGPFGGYDLTIGTSERGEVNDARSISLPPYEHALVVIGGPQGLEYALSNDECRKEHREPSTLFDRYLNVCPDQGSRTIRTEEAVLLCLMYLKEALLFK